MIKIRTPVLAYSTLGLIVLRFIIFLAVVYAHIELGHFIDLSILGYLTSWLLCVRRRGRYPLLYLFWVNFIVAVISTLISDILFALCRLSLYTRIFKSSELLRAVLIDKVYTFLEIIGLSILASIGYYVIQSMIGDSDNDRDMNLDIESPK